MSIEKTYSLPSITLLLQPGGQERTLPRPKTVLQLLGRLGIRRGTALVIRDGVLLTPDRAILPGDHITVRVVTSSG